MTTGQIISGAGHLGLIAWALLGGAFRSEPLPFEVTEVTAISAEEYAALTAPERAPEAAANVDTPEPPEAGQAPAMQSAEDTPPDRDRPEATATAEPDTTPEDTPTPPARAEVGDDAPVMQAPAEDTAVLAPELSERPTPRPAPRVAPDPVAPPDPELRIDDVERPETAPDADAEAVEEDDPAAREEATTEIVTEAEQTPGAAPARSARPRARPERAATDAPDEAAPDETPPVDDSAVEDAIAAALGDAGATGDSPRAPSGPPLSAGEKDALRVAVEKCWNVGSLSTEALATTVVVAVEMFEDGRPDTGSIRMVDFTGGSAAAAERAYAAARRAIIRCGIDGYDLPAGKYDRWRDIEMTFNPEKMRIK